MASASKLWDFWSPIIIGVGVYYLLNKYFPETESLLDEDFENLDPKTIQLQNFPPENPQEDLRGGNIEKTNLAKKLLNLSKEIFNRIMHDRNLKITLGLGFFSALVRHFNGEIYQLLLHDAVKEICTQDLKGQVKGKLKIVCDIVKEHQLELHPRSVGQILLNNNLSREAKINLLKIKLDYILNGTCGGKTRFIVITIIAFIVTITLSGVTGLAIFLEAVYRLFQEGKISKVVYEQIKTLVTKMPVEDLQDLL